MLLPNWVVILAICCGRLLVAEQVQSSGDTKANEETRTLDEEMLGIDETQINEQWISPPGSHMYVRRNIDPASEDEGHKFTARKLDNPKNVKVNSTKPTQGPPYTQYRGYPQPYSRPGVPLLPSPVPLPAPAGFSYGGVNPLLGSVVSTDLLMAGLFFQDKCVGAPNLISGYIPLFTFNKQNVCARAFKSLTPVGCIQTVTSKNLKLVSVNQIKVLISVIEYKGDQIIVIVVGLVFEGSAQGFYVAVRALFSYAQLFRLCAGLLGNPSLASIDAIMVIADVPTLDLVDCHGAPKACFEKVRNKKLLECNGQILLS